MTRLNLEQIARAMVLCFVANIPVAIWGESGGGKSSIARQVARRLMWGFYDVRLSDKEPSDFAIPYPIGGKKLTYLMTDLLPWGGDEKCVICFDEYDRASMAVQNMSLQVILDRSAYGKSLPENARLVLCGNQSTDIGTSELSTAAARRMCHLYLETYSEGALASWTEWAGENGISPALRSFARYRKDVWANGSDKIEMTEYGSPAKRTFDMADRLWQATKSVDFQTSDILRAIVEGCIGTAAANELLAWYQVCENAPTIEEVTSAPEKAKLPTDLGIIYAFTLTLTDYASNHPKTAEAIAKYAIRLDDEQCAFLMKRLLDKVPEVAATTTFAKWENKRR